jgi:hypothetical protein
MLRVPFLIFAALTTALVLYQIRVSSFGTAYVDGAGQMRTLSQQIAKASQLALQGDPNAFGELEQSRASSTSSSTRSPTVATSTAPACRAAAAPSRPSSPQ